MMVEQIFFCVSPLYQVIVEKAGPTVNEVFARFDKKFLKTDALTGLAKRTEMLDFEFVDNKDLYKQFLKCAWSKTKVNTYHWRLIASDVASNF